MPAYWLTFKPKGPNARRGWPMEKLKDLVRRFDSNPTTAMEWWRISSRRSARVGDRVYLFKQGAGPRGIFGVGTIVDGPELRDSPADDEGEQPRALVRFDKLVDPEEGFLLSLSEIEDIVPPTSITAQSSGTSLPEEISSELDRRLAPWLTPSPPLDAHEADDTGFDPESVSDERERALRAIRIRRGQPAFRAALLETYQNHCAITGCPVVDVLEAAHITPHLGPLTNHLSNGLLLRADIHTLFDCGLIAVDPETRRVVVAGALEGSTYAKLAGKPLRQPANSSHSPSKKNLEKRFALFQALQVQVTSAPSRSASPGFTQPFGTNERTSSRRPTSGLVS
jgi:putative restriction endonuclease